MNTEYTRRMLEAALLAAGRTLSLAELAQLFEEVDRPDSAQLREALASLGESWSDRGIELAETALGYRAQVRREFAEQVARMWPERPPRYSRALLETLVIIAYRQPLTRAEIEAVRGVAVNPNIVRTLFERNWIRVVGHREVPGRPELLGTTRDFLDYFGLKTLDQLPPLAEIKSLEELDPQLALPEPVGLNVLPPPAVMGESADDEADDETANDDEIADPQPEEDLPGSAAPTPDAGEGERVQKIIARAGLASRREAEDWIRAGRVSINGEPATLGSRAHGSDQIRLDGRMIHKAPVTRAATWLCHRSPGEDLLPPRNADDATAATPERGAVSERLSRRVGRRYIAVSPMPPNDGGLELLTSDGELAARLQRAVRRLPMEFSVRVRGELTPQQIEAVLAGRVQDADPLQVEACEAAGGEGSNRWYRIVARGAHGRTVRALVEQQEATVSRVLRVAMGGLKLERTLTRGQVRQLTEGEIGELLAAAN